MSDSPRWERESHEDLSAPVYPPQDTVEMELPAPLGVDPDELSDPPEYHGRDLPGDPGDGAEAPESSDGSPRLPAARESLIAGRESARETLVATRAGARRQLTATRASARVAAAAARVSMTEAAESLTDTAGRAGRWVAALDRRPEFDADARRDPVAELGAGPDLPVAPEPPSPGIAGAPAAPGPADATISPIVPEPTTDREPALGDRMPAADRSPGRASGHVARFPIALRGYDRESVDRHLNELELELARLRTRVGPMSITEEIERLGEQAASILVTAHDSASETSRRAQEQAARAVTEAADDAERITADAQRRLRELDEETDAVWRERERLLGDVRQVSATLATLAETAVGRFPAAEAAGRPGAIATVTGAAAAEPEPELDPEPQPEPESAGVIAE